LYESGNTYSKIVHYILITRRHNRKRVGSASTREQEISMSRTKTLTAISAAIALGIVGAASVAQANDSGENNMGGYVIPGSTVGVNPAYHPGWFGKGSAAYGFAASPSHKHRPAHVQTENR
jgi:hypothetical protein